jgi:hypothetical protein
MAPGSAVRVLSTLPIEVPRVTIVLVRQRYGAFPSGRDPGLGGGVRCGSEWRREERQ